MNAGVNRAWRSASEKISDALTSVMAALRGPDYGPLAFVPFRGLLTDPGKRMPSVRRNEDRDVVHEGGILTLPSPEAELRGQRPILTLMAECGLGSFLWHNRCGLDDNGVGGNCCDLGLRCNSHPMSDELYGDLVAWATEVDTAPWTAGTLVDPNEPGIYAIQPQLILDWDDFHARGLELAKRLKAEAAPVFRVIYGKPFEDPRYRDEERREVPDDGAVVVLPRRLP